jgi:hypothetical protein
MLSPRKHTRLSPAFLVPLVVVVLGAVVPSGWADRDKVTEIPLEAARIYIEFNSTDNDLGFHVFLDGEDWRELKIVKPDGRTIFEVQGRGAYADLGMTELFFEGAEPSLDEVPLAELLALFPEGVYQFLGKTVEGDNLVGAATLTHAIPDGPSILSPEEDEVVNPGNAVIRWKSVTSPPGIQVVGYEVIVGSSSFRLPAAQTSLKVPPEILERGTEYEFEVLAIEAGGNQTITASSFVTR